MFECCVLWCELVQDGKLIFIFPLITCYRWPCLIALLVVWCELSTTNQVSVLNHRLPKYGIYFMYTALEYVIVCFRLHSD